MAFDLATFRTALINGGARPNLFEAQFTWPNLVRGAAGISQAESNVRILCHTAEIPESTMGTIEVPYFGFKLKFAGVRSFENATFGIYNDEDFGIRNALEIWSAAIQGHDTTTSLFSGGIDSNSYVTDGVVTQYGRSNGGQPIRAYQLVGMFPVSVGKIELSYEQDNAIETFSTTFAYQYWIPVDPSSGTPIGLTTGL